MSKVVDVSINLRGHTKLPFYQTDRYSVAKERGVKQWTSQTLLAAMDAAGVDVGGVISSVAALGAGGEVDAITAEEVHQVVDGHRDRLFGWVGINPETTMETLRLIEHAVVDLGFTGVHVYPHWFNLRVDDRKYYPIYAKCAELGVPIALQVGTQTPRNRARLQAKPSWLDPVAFDFPELTIMGIHVGTPWTDEMIFLCRNYENVYMIADARQPSTWEPELIAYLRSEGRHQNMDGAERILWGTDWPIQDFAESIAEVKRLGLPADVEANLLGGNAQRVLGL